MRAAREGPWGSHLEPVDGAAREESWELAQSVPEGLAARGHGQHHVQLLPDPLHEERPQRRGAPVRLQHAG